MTNIVYFNEDVKEVLARYQNYFQFIFDDPPYNLESMVKRFGSKGAAAAKGDVYNRASRGFMQQQWDTDISFDPELWSLTLKAAAPGAYVVSFGGTRTAYRLATAAAQAGFDVLDYIEYIYGSGFPKSQNIHLDIKKAVGEEYAALFEGFRASTALKPAHEPVYIFRKPYEDVSSRQLWFMTGEDHWRSEIIIGENGRTNGMDKAAIKQQSQSARAFLEKRLSIWKRYGVVLPAGLVCAYTMKSLKALNPDSSSFKVIEAGEFWGKVIEKTPYKDWKTNGVAPNVIAHNAGTVNVEALRNENGNWPANVILNHSPFCVVGGDESYCDDSCPVNDFSSRGGNGKLFIQASYDYEIAEIMSTYISKPTRSEKDAGLGDLPYREKRRLNSGGLSNEPRWAVVPAKNHHPTTKSIDFCKKIGNGFLPPAQHPRRALVRFGGTGSEAIGLLLAADKNGLGWDEIVIAELDPEYFEILEPRVAWWKRQRELGMTGVSEIIAQWKVDLIDRRSENAGEPRQLQLMELL